MLFVFHEDGTVEFTRNPTALALVQELGPVQITRMSEIKFDFLEQKYYIQFCTGEFAGLVLRWYSLSPDRLETLWTEFWQWHSPGFALDDIIDAGKGILFGGTVFFKTYEDAVAVEVAFIDFLREQGIRVQ